MYLSSVIKKPGSRSRSGSALLWPFRIRLRVEPMRIRNTNLITCCCVIGNSQLISKMDHFSWWIFRLVKRFFWSLSPVYPFFPSRWLFFIYFIMCPSIGAPAFLRLPMKSCAFLLITFQPLRSFSAILVLASQPMRIFSVTWALASSS